MYKCNNSTILFLDLPQKHPQNDELSVPKIHAVLSFHSMLCLLWLKKQNMAQCCTCSLKDKRGNSTCDTTCNWYSQAPPLPIKDSNAFQFLQVTRQAVRFLQVTLSKPAASHWFPFPSSILSAEQVSYQASPKPCKFIGSAFISA